MSPIEPAIQRSLLEETLLEETDLDGAAARLVSEGIDHEGPQEGGGARVLQLLDPDGNRVVLSGI